jgi:RHS repeat-associated protein
MTTDDQGRTLGYDSLGRLKSIQASTATTSYHYDGLSVRREQQLADGSSLEFYYRGHYPISVIKHPGSGDTKTAWLRKGGNAMLETGPGGSQKDIVTDGNASVVATGDAGGLKARGYTAYGYAPPDDSAQSALGYNGEYTDPVTGNYHLGNGYRAFSPALARFTAPDSLSPFGGGGLNTYAYCEGDPINSIDPTGHIKLWQGIVIGIFSVATIGLTLFDVAEVVQAVIAIQRLTRIARIAEEAVDGAENAAKAAQALKWNRYKVAWHVMFGGVGVVSAGFDVTSYIAAFAQKATVSPNGHVKSNWAFRYLEWAPKVMIALGIVQGFNLVGRAVFTSERLGTELMNAPPPSVRMSDLSDPEDTNAPSTSRGLRWAHDVRGELDYEREHDIVPPSDEHDWPLEQGLMRHAKPPKSVQ